MTKTVAHCKNDMGGCKKLCDSLIDVGDNVQRCKNNCELDYIKCTPSQSTAGTGGNVLNPSVGQLSKAQIYNAPTLKTVPTPPTGNAVRK